MKNVLILTGARASFPSGAAPGAPPLVYQQDNSRVRIGGGGYNTTNESSPNYYEGTGSWAVGMGFFVETTIEQGYTRLLFEGINSSANATFDAYKNGVLVGSGSQGGKNLYYDQAGLAAGDVMRFVNTSSGIPFFVDQFTQLSS